MKLIVIISLVVANFLLTAAGYIAPSPPVANKNALKISGSDTTKLQGLWFLQPVLPSDTGMMKTPFLKFDVAKKMVSGNTGCNSFTGEFGYTDTSITFNKNMATTKMACIGYDETAFLRNLLRVNSYKLKDGVLMLTEGRTEISRWARKSATKTVIGHAAP